MRSNDDVGFPQTPGSPPYYWWEANNMLTLFSHELQRRLDQDPLLSNISVLALDPGAMPTGIFRHSESWMMRFVMFPVSSP